jgi:hypothetical protein
MLIVRLRTVACFSVGSMGRNSASTFAACRYGIMLTVEQALPALVNLDFPTTNVAELAPALNRDCPFHRHRFPSEQSDADGLRGPNNPYSTPEKLPVSLQG